MFDSIAVEKYRLLAV